MINRGHQFTRVSATSEEIAKYRDSHNGSGPGRISRVKCNACGLRMWGAGLAIGSHGRTCEVAAADAEGYWTPFLPPKPRPKARRAPRGVWSF